MPWQFFSRKWKLKRNWEKLEKKSFVLNSFHSYSCTIVWPGLIPSRSRWGSGQERGLSPCRWVWRAAGGSLPLRLTFSSTPSPQNPVFNTWPDALNYSTFSIFHMAPFSMFVALALCNFHGKKMFLSYFKTQARQSKGLVSLVWRLLCIETERGLW